MHSHWIRQAVAHSAALLGYAAMAIVYSYPLITHLDTHVTGGLGGDAGAYVWNQWVFRHEMTSGGRKLFETGQILALTEPADLSFHNYTVFADLVSLPLQERLGLVTAFNIVYLMLSMTSAYAMFLLALALVRRWPEAFLAGFLFGFSPFLSARGTAHFSLVAAAPLPLFVFFLLRAGQSGSRRWAAAAGATLGWAAYCDPYYLVFCILILVAAVAYASLRITYERQSPSGITRRLARALEAVALVLAVLVGAIALTGGGRFRVAGLDVVAKTLYTPVLLLVLTLAGRVLISIRPRVERTGRLSWPMLAGLVGAGSLAALALLWPLLLAIARRLARGAELASSIPWRSSPAGVDLLSFLMPNPSHPLFGEPFRDWLARDRPDAFVENAASLTLTALAVVLLALWRRVALPRSWVWFTVFFMALAFGPFLMIGGFKTGLPTPWTLLRYVPGVSLVRSPTRFAIVAMMGFALLFAFALRDLFPHASRLRTLLLAGVALLLGFELAPFPRQLYAAEAPSVYTLIAHDPCPVRVLDLPFGLRDGTRSVGDFNPRAQFHQTIHGKPLVGGYLSRISERRVNAYKRFPLARALLTLSEGGTLSAEDAELARWAAPRFLDRSRVGFVVVDRNRASHKLRRFATSTLDLRTIARDGPYELLVPAASLCETAGSKNCAHTSPGCTLRALRLEGTNPEETVSVAPPRGSGGE